MLKLNSITIEGMHNVDKKTYQFDDLNYLFGHNGAGKSTVLQAIQLAILGYIPGTNKTKEAIFSHSNNHTMAVTAELVGDNNITIQRIWTKSGRGITSNLSIDPDTISIDNIVKDIELPIFNFNEFVNMTANKLKEWFISFAPSETSEIDWKSVLEPGRDALKEATSTLFDDVINEVDSYEETGIDACKKLNTYLKSMLSAKKSELQRSENTIQSLIYYDDCDESLDIDDLKLQIAKLQSDKSQYLKNSALAANNSATLKMIDDLKDKLDSDCYGNDPAVIRYAAELPIIDKRLSEIDNEVELINKDKIEVSSIIHNNKAIINGHGVCSYTGEVCDSIQEKLADLSEQSQEAESQLANLNNRIINLNEEKNELLKRVKDYTNTLSTIKSNYDKYNTLRSSITDVVPVTSDPIDYDAEIENLYSTISKIESNQRYNKLMDTITNEKFKVELEIQVLKKWIAITDANGLQTELSEKPFELVKHDLDKYLKYFFETSEAQFNLTTKANSFSFGLNRDNQYISFDLLSSGEKCLYTIALMMCIINNTNSDIKCIIIDDLLDHLDDDNINKLFESLYNVKLPIQFIFAGVKQLSDNVPGCIINI